MIYELSPLDIADFWSRADRQGNGCWLWTGRRLNSRSPNHHYGAFALGGRRVAAHRIAYSLVYGDIPDGLNVLHHCDQTLCIAPACLFLGTQADNVADMIAKGRKRVTGRKGIAHHGAKLSDASVLAIRRIADEGGRSQQEIAQLFGVSQSTVSEIVRRNHWSHLTEEGRAE